MFGEDAVSDVYDVRSNPIFRAPDTRKSTMDDHKVAVGKEVDRVRSAATPVCHGSD
jgi:hypothetical protein